MFAIASTRFVGLIAVVCAVVVAPQAHSRIAPPDVEPPQEQSNVPAPVQGYDLSGLDLSVLNGIRGYQQHEEYLRGLPRAALAAAGPNTSVTASSRAAAIKALQRRSVDLDAAYRKLYPGAYRQAVQKSDKAAVWRFPACSPSAAAEYDSYSGDPCIWTGPAPTVGTIVLAAMFGYMPTNPGWGAAATAAKKSAAEPALEPAPAVCVGLAEYDSVCELWS